MIADEIAWSQRVLAEPVREPEVRLWHYPKPGVVLGPAQRPDDDMVARAKAAGADLVQRPAGGGAVLAGPWILGASIVLPPGHPLVPQSIPASYGWLGDLFVAWLAELGIAGRPAPAPLKADPQLAWSCFAGLSHGEVVVNGKKIVGLAQARRRNGTLFSTGVLVSATPWALLCDVLGKPAEQAAELARTTTSVAEETCASNVGDDPEGRLSTALFRAASG